MEASTAHAQSLRVRHQQLESELAEEMKHPARDPIRMTEIKREKLRIKEQLELG